MTCREVISLLMDYLSGELPVARSLALHGHVVVCNACGAYVRTYRRTVELARGAYAPTAGTGREEIPEELGAAILATHEARVARCHEADR